MTAQQVKTGQSLLERLVFVLLLACAISIQSIDAHDFGGPSSGGGEDPPPPPGPPCNSCPCAGPGGGGGGGGDGGGGGSGGGGPGNTTGNPSGSGGKPVSFYNGAEEMVVTDLVVNGIFPIVIQRKYDSRSSYDSPLGYGWAFLHDRHLYEYPDNSVIVRHGCGTRDRYVYSGGAYVTPTGSMLASLSEEPDGSFRLKYLNGITDTFDSQGRLIAATDVRGNRHEYTYDPLGKLPLVGSSKESISPTTPMTVAYTYRLTRIDVRGADGALTGRYVTFGYDQATGRLASVASDDGRSVSYQHDSTQSLTLGNLTQIDGLEGIVSTYAYADPLDPHNLTSITPSQGRTPIINTYDDQDRVTRQEEGTRRMDIVYNVPYTRTTVTKTIRDQNGLNPYIAATTYEFDTTGRVTKLIDALGHETRYTYNATKMLARKEIWQKDGGPLSLLQAMDWLYDGNGNKLTEGVTLDSGETVTRTWTYEHNWIASEQVVSSAAPAKVFRSEYTFYFGSNGQPTNVQSEKRRKDDGSFQTTTYTYDSRNRLLTTTLPDGVQTMNEYTGDYVTRTYFVVGGSPLVQMERRFEYDTDGNLTKQWDARNNLTQYAYDDRRRLTSVINPLGEQTLYTFTQEKLTQVEAGRTAADGEGQVMRFLYDASERLIGIQRKNDAGSFVDYHTFQLDSLGRRVVVTDAEGRNALLTYDLAGRLKTVTDPTNKMMQLDYDATGNRISIKDPLNREIRFEFDNLNRVTAIVELGLAPNPRTQYVYDAADNIVSVTDAENHTTTYQYDALTRTTRVTPPLGQFVEYAYDPLDRVDFIVNARGNKIDYSYEAWGSVKDEKQYSTASSATALRTVAYAYDNDGNVITITDDAIQPGPAYSFTYDAVGRVYNETAKYIPGGDRLLQHRYDRFGNRKELNLGDAATLSHTYTYNKLNQLASANLAGAPISISHLGNDHRQSVTLPNGMVESFTYRPNGLVENMTFTGPAGQMAQLVHTYDDLGNLDTQTDQYGVHEFDHDALNRLIGVLRPGASTLPGESYDYDRVGNRKDPAQATLYGYDANNRITASPGRTYTFNADGSLQTRSDGATFTHDPQNRLVQYMNGATTVNYVYDARGRRVGKTVNGTATWFLWDGMTLLAEYDATGNRTKRYAYLDGDNAPTQMQDANGTYYVHSDRLQAPRWVTNSSAQIVWRSQYQAFGKATVEGDPDGNGVTIVLNIRFPGQYEDPETGLHYNVMRDYDPSLGRYISADPLGLAAGPNPYIYVGSRPTGAIDPLGLYTGSKTPTCVETSNNVNTTRRDWVKQKQDFQRRIRAREIQPNISPGPMSSRDPRIGPSWNITYQLWWQERLVVTVWNGYTLTTKRRRVFRCEATWQEDCGPPEHFVSWQTREDILKVHTFWGVPTRYEYDWEWAGPAGSMTFPPM